jgi:2-polyprenyl-3-methyl-5-hydroxy-6-metoxy-1,4-benzoquinol methylase
MFNRRFAERDARTFRERGLGKTARTLVELAGAVDGERVLDVGGGIGAIGLTLLERGAAHATNVELSSGYEDVARELAAERDATTQVERRVADFVEEADAIAEHDVVVMHRVVCCYPDLDALLDTAARHARRTLVLTYPQERLWIRAGLTLLNVFLRLRGCGFRTYLHPAERIHSPRHGLRLDRVERNGLLWESAALVR